MWSHLVPDHFHLRDDGIHLVLDEPPPEDLPAGRILFLGGGVNVAKLLRCEQQRRCKRKRPHRNLLVNGNCIRSHSNSSSNSSSNNSRSSNNNSNNNKNNICCCFNNNNSY
jgi:hypothetical protein